MKPLIIIIGLAAAVGAALALQKTGPREIETDGEIVAVSVEETAITLEETTDPADESAHEATHPGVRREFLINEETKLTVAGAPVELDEIDPGSFATIRYVMDFGTNVALSVEVRSRPTD